MEAQTHPRQKERLALLDSYEILDTDREREFDDIVKLAAEICGTDISVINFIDAERQWFKAETGLGTRETPLATSICSHAILEEDFVEIHDTLQDPRMADNPLCCGDPGLRFYAGAILKSTEGLPLGTLCVLDYTPKRLTPLQRDTLRVLARQVMAQLDMRKALRNNALLRQEVDHRVKNSLQSLAALVRIQERRAAADETKAALSSIQSRIEAVSQLHEQLYRTDSGPVVSLKAYLQNLVGQFAAVAPQNVQVSLEARDFHIASRQAVAVGTLVNEFVANAFKHAFPDGRAGHVAIRVDAGHAKGAVRITCADDGIGLPDDSDPQQGGLGMLITQVICGELQCELEVNSSADGLTLGLEFALDSMH